MAMQSGEKDQKTTSSVAIIIPAFNEEPVIAQEITKMKSLFDSVIVVNDGSHDNTKKEAEKTGCIVVNHPVNRGLGAALKTGINVALMLEADIIVTFDADGQHNVDDIKTLITPLEQKEADIVIGTRFNDEDLSHVPSEKLVGNILLTILTSVFSGVQISDSQSGLRAFTKEVAQKMELYADGYAISSEIVFEAARHKFAFKEIPIDAIYSDYHTTKSTRTKVHHGLDIVLHLFKRVFRRN